MKGTICFGTLAVYRITFVLAMFHLLMAAVTFGASKKGDCRVGIQDGYWIVKIILIIAGTIGAFFIPNPFFEYYGWFALFASGFFILIQLLFLIDFAHSWAENWIGKMEESEAGDNQWWYILLGTTGAMYVVTLAFTILMAIFFASDAVKCSENVIFITLNVALCFLLSIFSIHPKVQEGNERSGLLQAALISVYATYLVWSAMMSESDGCNPWRSTTSAASNMALLIGALFTIIAVCYATVRTASQVGNIQEGETEPLTKNEEDDGEKSEDHHDEEKAVHEDADEPVGYSFSKFHVVFALGAMYICMLMSDWHTVYQPGTDNPRVDTGLAAVWVKIVSSWLCVGLYLWTLAGPILWPDRVWHA